MRTLLISLIISILFFINCTSRKLYELTEQEKLAKKEIESICNCSVHIEKDEQVEYYGDKNGTLYIELNYNNRNPNNCFTSVREELIEQASEIFKKFKSNMDKPNSYSTMMIEYYSSEITDQHETPNCSKELQFSI